MHLRNSLYNSIDGTYNTEMVIKPLEGRDNVGSYDVFIDCEFIEYPDISVFSQQI